MFLSNVKLYALLYWFFSALSGYAFYNYLRGRVSTKPDETDISTPVKKKLLGPTGVLHAGKPTNPRALVNFACSD